MSHSGRCLCGAIRFSATHVEARHHACHCGMCRRWAGGPVFAALAHEVAFEGGENLQRFKSSEWAERGFCRHCGSHLFYFLVPVAQYLMSVGSFEDGTPFELAQEIFIDHKPAGYAFAGDHPRLTEQETLAEHGVAADSQRSD